MTTAEMNAELAERNRRESFRINDRVALSVRPLRESEYREARRRVSGQSERRRTLNSIIASGENQRGALRSIRDADPSIGAYLMNLEERLEAMARLLSREHHDAPDAPTHDVNISGNGMRFHHDEALARGARVALDIQLFPARTCLSLFGTVVRVSELKRAPRNGGRFLVAVDYSDIHDDDRELLIRHIHSLQLDYARRGVLQR